MNDLCGDTVEECVEVNVITLEWFCLSAGCVREREEEGGSRDGICTEWRFLVGGLELGWAWAWLEYARGE